METFLIWLSANPIIANILLVVLVIIILSLIMMYAIAFVQGREVSFWPPKIGAKLHASEQNLKKAVENSNSENLHKNSSLAIPNKRITEEDIKLLIKRHNDDFCKVLDSRDNRYLKATTTDKGASQARQDITNLLSFMQENKLKFTHPVEISLLNWRLVSDNKVVATTDETWEEIYLDGHLSQLVDRNIYEIVFEESMWLVDSCEVLPSADKL